MLHRENKVEDGDGPRSIEIKCRGRSLIAAHLSLGSEPDSFLDVKPEIIRIVRATLSVKETCDGNFLFNHFLHG